MTAAIRTHANRKQQALLLLTYYLPVWFQVIKGVGPQISGVMTLPTMISQALSAVIAGKLVSKIGYYTPFALGGSMLASIGSGLMTTFVPSTSTGKWIGYQIMTGVGRGMVLQMPLTAINDLLSSDDIASAVAVLIFCQYFGGALFLALGQTVLLARLGPALQSFAPNVRADEVINAGATNIRAVIPAAELAGVLLAYNRALTQTFVSLLVVRPTTLTTDTNLSISQQVHRASHSLRVSDSVGKG
jgi:hypothetical protein